MQKGFQPKPSTPPVQPTVEAKPVEPVVEKPEVKVEPVKPKTYNIKYREVVYVGVAQEAERIGVVTGNRYLFYKDSYKMPIPTSVDERDYPMLVSERGRGCARRDPETVFMSKVDWDLEIQQARAANSQ